MIQLTVLPTKFANGNAVYYKIKVFLIEKSWVSKGSIIFPKILFLRISLSGAAPLKKGSTVYRECDQGFESSQS
jgi:hypothetical protein